MTRFLSMLYSYIKSIIVLSFCISSLTFSLFSQDIEEKEDVEGKSKVYVLGIDLTNRGWGLSSYYGVGDESRQLLIGIDIHSIKSTREAQIESFYEDQGKKYVYGKLNYFYVITPSVGFQNNLIPTGTGNLLNIRVGAQIGPAIGLTNPYSVEIFEPVSGNNPRQNFLGYRVIEAYNPEEHRYEDIIGRANILSSKLDLKAKLGLSVKAHVLVDFTGSPKYIGGLQFNFNADFFPNKIPIMSDMDGEIQNHRLFLAGGIGLVFGNRWQ